MFFINTICLWNIKVPACIKNGYFMQKEALLRYIQSLEERKKILLACHIDSTSGHLGKTRTLYRVKERFIWHGMVKNVVSLVS